jgi:hypothetical protein
MEHRNDLKIDRIGHAVQEGYAIPVKTVEFLPVGMVGRHYRVESFTGERFFITLYDEARLARIAANKLFFTLPAVHHLYQSGRFTNLVPPLVSLEGELQIDLDGWPLIVYPYQDGHLLAEEMPFGNGVQRELGELVARLHTATPALDLLQKPLRETFTFPFEEPLRGGLSRLARLGQPLSPGQAVLRELLVPRHGEVLQLLDQLYAITSNLRENPPTFVICHTDIHPWNVFRDQDGRLVVVDWEGVCLAPPEHDLFIFTGEGFEFFLEAYTHARGQRKLRPETFSFYFYRRNLEDLADYIVRILDEDNGPEIDRADIEGVEELIAGWGDLPTSIGRMEAIIKKLRERDESGGEVVD